MFSYSNPFVTGNPDNIDSHANLMAKIDQLEAEIANLRQFQMSQSNINHINNVLLNQGIFCSRIAILYSKIFLLKVVD